MPLPLEQPPSSTAKETALARTQTHGSFWGRTRPISQPRGGLGLHGFCRLAEEPCFRPSRFESGTVGPPLRSWRRQQQFRAARLLRDAQEENLDKHQLWKPSKLKVCLDRRMGHRDKAAEHLETRVRPGGRRTTRCSACLGRSDAPTSFSDEKLLFQRSFRPESRR